MKSFTKRLAVFTASAVMLGTMAYGQTTMNAEIPFAFHTANASLPAGNYTINPLINPTNTMRLYNTDTRRGVFVGSLPIDVFRGAADKPVLVFACADQICTLREIKTSNGTYSYPESHKTAHDREAVSLIEVPLTLRNGD
jgi:hypothetical protein